LTRDERERETAWRVAMQAYHEAVLLERGLKPWEIARLTDRQIEEGYFHPRDEHGSLLVPSRPLAACDFGDRYIPCASLEEELAQFAELQGIIFSESKGKSGLTNYESAVEQIRAKWADGSRAQARRTWEEQQREEVTNG
jgi:hypothetical protein